MIELIEKLGIPILIGLASASVATKLALSKFRGERLWEKKVESYTNLVTALHHMKRPRESFIEAEEKAFKIDEKDLEDLWTRSRDARREVEKAADIAGFLISAEIGKTVKTFELEMEAALDKIETHYELYLDEHAAITKCLSSVKEIAQKELKL